MLSWVYFTASNHINGVVWGGCVGYVCTFCACLTAQGYEDDMAHVAMQVVNQRREQWARLNAMIGFENTDAWMRANSKTLDQVIQDLLDEIIKEYTHLCSALRRHIICVLYCHISV